MHEDRIRAKAGRGLRPGLSPGRARPARSVAILASPDRTPALAKVEVPTLVIHGESDPLVDPSGRTGHRRRHPGRGLWTIPGMGHDLPPELFEQVADRVAALAPGVTDP